jgi:hypothetical protein
MIGLGLPAMLLFAWIATKWFGHVPKVSSTTSKV